jgi:hypothetical protein
MPSDLLKTLLWVGLLLIIAVAGAVAFIKIEGKAALHPQHIER